MQVFYLEKKSLHSFLATLQDTFELIAPVKRDLVQFETVQDTKDIYLKKNAYFPIKEYFFKKEEVLFTFSKNKIFEPKLNSPNRVFFGIRKCDLNGVKHQDIVFQQDTHDPYYVAARKNSYLIGYHCKEAPSPYCFCGSLELDDFFDLMFYEKGTRILVEVGSDKGLFLIKKYKSFFKKTNKEISSSEKVIAGADRLEKKDISALYHHPDWQKGVDICLSCGACTALCPTCYCFSIHDELSLAKQNEGKRMREWSSCQLQGFTKVAGSHVFRKEREERFKHRIYHQLDYFKEKYGIQMCVGCGRCIEGCPTRIDFVKIINDMK